MEDITPWDHEEPTLNMVNYFQEPDKTPQRPSHLPGLAHRRIASQNRNLRSLPKETRKSMREINIQFPPPTHGTLGQQHRLDNALQEVSLRDCRNVGRRRESTYILKQKFATIRRSLIMMGENKENAVKSNRYDI